MEPSKPAEELYDMQRDPWEMHNLADSPEYQQTLERLRGELRRWMLDIRDTGFLPEPELVRRSAGESPYDMARRPDAYPLERIIDTAELTGKGPGELPKLEQALSDPDPAVRYWGAVGLNALGFGAAPAAGSLRNALRDESAVVRIAAAETLTRLGYEREALPVLIAAVEDPDGYTALHAAASLVYLGRKARPAVPALEKATARGGEPAEHFRYLGWALNAVKENL